MSDLADGLRELLLADPTLSTDALVEHARRVEPLRSLAEIDRVVTSVRRRADGLEVLGPLLSDETVGEVMISGTDVWVERAGVIESTPLALEPVDIELLVERILQPLGLRVDPASPLVDARLPDGSRINVVVPPLSLDGPAVTIRRFSKRTIGLEHFVDGAAELDALVSAVRSKRSILVVGGTGAGKTTLLNALAAHIDPHDRIVTVEDTAELQLRLPHVVRLESRPANAEGVGRVDLGDLLRNALRMRPDRIVVGEVRGGEALDLLLALNTGHDGSMATCHASTAAGGLERLALLAAMARPGLDPRLVRRQIATGLDAVVVVGRTERGRAVTEMADVVEVDGLPVAEPRWQR